MPTGPAESPAIAVHSLAVFDPDELVEAVGSCLLYTSDAADDL